MFSGYRKIGGVVYRARDALLNRQQAANQGEVII